MISPTTYQLKNKGGRLNNDQFENETSLALKIKEFMVKQHDPTHFSGIIKN